jgi:hypothetical protein
MNGVLNAGSGNWLLLAIPGCPIGTNAVLLGRWSVFDTGGQVCLVPSSASGTLGAVDCDVPVPHLWDLPMVEGFSSSGPEPCRTGEVGCYREEADPRVMDAPGGDDSHSIVAATRLDSPSPNPFTERAQLAFELVNRDIVSLAVYDVRGRLVRRMLDEERSAGRHAVVWDGRDESGLRVAPGIFFVRFEAGPFVGVRRMVLLPSE